MLWIGQEGGSGFQYYKLYIVCGPVNGYSYKLLKHRPAVKSAHVTVIPQTALSMRYPADMYVIEKWSIFPWVFICVLILDET